MADLTLSRDIDIFIGSYTLKPEQNNQYNKTTNTVKCHYNAVFGVQEIDRVIAVTAL